MQWFCAITLLVIVSILDLSAGDNICLVELVATPYYAPSNTTADEGPDRIGFKLAVCRLEGQIVEENPTRELCELVMPSGSATLPVFILTARNNFASLDKSFYSICRNGPAGVLAWVKYSDYILQIAPELPAFEGHSFIGRKLIEDVENATQLLYDNCMIDLTNGGCMSLETRKVIRDTKNTEILVEKLPIRYELRNAKFSEWKNITHYEKEVVGTAVLKNWKTYTSYAESDIHFRVSTERTIEFPTNFVRNTHLDIYKNDLLFSTYTVGVSQYSPIEGNITAIKKVPALQAMHVFAEGTKIKEVQSIEGDLYIIYDEDDKRTNSSRLTVTTVLTSIANVNLKYGELLDVELAPSEDNKIITDSPQTDVTTESLPRSDIEINATVAPNPPNGIYPGFKSIFIIGAIIIFSVALIAAADVSRKILESRRKKRTAVYNAVNLEEINQKYNEKN